VQTGTILNVANVLAGKKPTGAKKRQWRRPVPEEHINHHPPFISAVIAAVAAVLIGYVITLSFVMAAWLVAAHGTESTFTVMRAAGVTWQVLHLTPVAIGTVTLGILPWGFLLVPILIVWKATQWALKSARPKNAFDFVRVAVSFSTLYASLAFGLSLISNTPDLSTSVTRSSVNAFVLALLVTFACINTYAPSRTIVTDAMPTVIVNGIRPGLIAFGLLFTFASLLTSISIALHWVEIQAVTTLMAPGTIDGFLMTLLGIGYVPTVGAWTLSYILGPGILLGSGGIVTSQIASPGALPAFPLLSILPNETPPFASFLIAIPVLIGILIYFLLPRERWDAQGDSLAVAMSFVLRWREMVTLFVALATLGILVWLTTAASSGSLGTSFLKYVGPMPNQVALAAISICGATALLTLLLPRLVLSVIHWLNHRDVAAK
jgi:hypothetical protein